MKLRYKHIIFISLVSILSSCNTAKLVPKGECILIKNKISSTQSNFDTEPVYSYLKQKENTKTALLFNFHLWVYNMAHDKSGKEKKIKRWLGIYKLGDIIGEPPVILDKELIQVSRNQISKYMRNKGYYEATVADTVIYYGRKDKKAKVYYNIFPGTPTKIDTLFYTVKDANINEIINSGKSKSLIKKGDKLDVDKLQSERKRIAELLKENGYFLFNKEYIYYQVDTLDKKPNTANLEIKILNPDSAKHQKYIINDVYLFNNFNPQTFLKYKEQYYREFDTVECRGKFFLNRDKKPHIHSKFLAKNLYIDKGQLYSSSNVKSTYRQLSSLNEYQLINIRYNRLQGEPKVDVLVQLTPFKKHNYVTELEGTNSSGDFGIGGRLKYQHKSLFRRAEILNISLYGRLETRNQAEQSKNDLKFNSKEVGATASIDFPKFLLPFPSEKFIKRNHPRTMLGLNINYKTRPEYTRSIYGGSFGYYWISQRFFRHQFKPIDISAVKVFDMNKEYSASIQNTHLERSFDNYLISATNYTMYFTTKKKKLDESYFTIIAGAETAGDVLGLYSKSTNREMVNGSYEFFDNTFAQYWRTELNVIFNQKVARDRLVYRVYTGLAKPHGNISVMPYVKQFYSGGANSLRAWPVRSLGPGSYNNENDRFYNEVGDFKIEGNLEYRFKLFWLMEGAWFVDAGNIWSTNSKDAREKAKFSYQTFLSEIAIGSGLGLRFDFSYLIFRIDYGVKIKDPKEEINNRWLWKNKSYSPFKNEFFAINFGIGYPF